MSEKSPTTYERFTHWIASSLAVKLMVILFLLLLMLIPQNMVRSLIYERQNYQSAAEMDISGMVGGAQTVAGPYLSIPITSRYQDKDDKVTYRSHVITLLPEDLKITGELADETLHRGIFDVIIYEAELGLSGTFDLAELEQIDLSYSTVHYDRASLVIEISDLRGIDSSVLIEWNGSPQETRAGVPSGSRQGIHASLELSPEESKYSFTTDLAIKGTKSIYFTPIAKTNDFALSSSWPSPKFTGYLTPDERTVSDQGFTAAWQIHSLNRSYPQVWLDATHGFGGTGVGVELIQPVDFYSKNQRAIKYSFLVVAFIFLIYFFFEIGKRMRIHPLRYVLVGLNLSLFFLLLLALSEHVGFAAAYAIAAAAHILVLTAYTAPVFKHTRALLLLVGLMIFIFAYVYVLLSLEDYALLVGSVGLFVILSVVMLVSRKLDWYDLSRTQNDPS